MNIIGCLDRPTSGSYQVLGQEAANLSPDDLAALRRNTFGFVFQRYNLLNTSTAAENVEVPALYAGISAHERAERANKLLAQLGLGDRGGHRPGQLSGGQQQRVAIARSLMNNPPLILADEPTGALDSRSGEDVMNLLKGLHREGRTIVLITHDEKVAAHAHRIIHIRDGKILKDEKKETASAATITSLKPKAATGHSHVSSEIAESVKTALRALRANLFRTALTLLGIIIGVAAVVTMMAVGQGSKQKVIDQISAMGTNILSVRPGMPGFRGSGDIATLTMDDATAILNISNVDLLTPQRSSRMTVRYGSIDYATTVQGVGASLPGVNDWPIARGTFFTDRDISTNTPVVVLGQTAYKTLFPNGDDPIGQYILLRNIPFEVIGLMKTKGATPWGSDQDDVAFVPITTGLVRLFGQNYLSNITVRVADLKKVDQTQTDITTLLTERHRTVDFSIRNTASLLETATATQNTLTILLGTVAAISLLVGGIGVMNIMLVSVTERTREIGIRMAAGARRRDIMIQFNTESAVVCIIGGLLGVLIGLLSGWVISLFGVKVIYSPLPALMAFSCAVATGLVFGYLPARKAARLDPVTALASE